MRVTGVQLGGSLAGKLSTRVSSIRSSSFDQSSRLDVCTGRFMGGPLRVCPVEAPTLDGAIVYSVTQLPQCACGKLPGLFVPWRKLPTQIRRGQREERHEMPAFGAVIAMIVVSPAPAAKDSELNGLDWKVCKECESWRSQALDRGAITSGSKHPGDAGRGRYRSDASSVAALRSYVKPTR